MAEDQHFDVVIIGTGAGGGTLGHRLATNGKKVLWLERGPFLPRERDNWQTDAVFVRGKYLAQELWYDRHGNEFQPEVNYYVGGNTKFYGAALFRLCPEDFGELRHHGGISPAWPISYDDLEPYYTQAEHLYLVHGQHGEDPTEGPASKQYAYPPVSHEPRIQQLNDDLEKLGLHPFHLPIGVNLQEVEPGRAARASVCIRCDRVDGFPCLLNAKSDSQVICVDPVLSQDNVTLITGANVQRLETDGSGRSVTEVVTLLEDGSETTFTGDIVVVACGAVNSAALLLRSRGDRYPDGLANSSGVVGRHYMRHNNDALMAVSREPNPTRFQKTLAMNDWYLGADDWDYPLGGIQMLGKSDDEEIHAQAPRWAGKTSPSRSWRTTPSTSGSVAKTCRRPTTGSLSTLKGRSTSALTRRTTSRVSSDCATNSTACSASWACTSIICWTAACTYTRACRSARQPTRRERSGSAPTPPRAHST
jgi:choline dehydrogenase-like flavoprotein